MSRRAAIIAAALTLVLATLVAGAWRLTGSPQPLRPLPPLRLTADGTPLESGREDVSPYVSLAVSFGSGDLGGLSATLDGRPLKLHAAGAGTAWIDAPRLAQGAWHDLRVQRRRGLLTAPSAVEARFRTVDPLQLFAGWTAGGGQVRVDVGGSAPLAQDATISARLARAGARVTHLEGRIVGRWPARAGTTYRVTIPAGATSDTGGFLPADFTTTFTPPADGSGSMLVQVAGEPRTDATGLRLQVYYVPTAGARADLARHARQIDVLSPQLYSVDGAGNLASRMDSEALAIAAAAGIEVDPLVSNADFSRQQGEQLLSHPRGAAATLAPQLIAEARAHGYHGFQLDFENLAGSDRDSLTAFTAALRAALRAAHLGLSEAVVPRKSAALGGLYDPWAAAYDYPGLAPATDWQSLMAYQEFGGGDAGAGPVAGLDWVEAVAQGSAAGLDPRRLYLGIPFYYNDFSSSPSPDEGGWRDLLPLAAGSDLGLEWDFASQSPYFRYTAAGVDHVVWLEEGSSLRAKLRLAKRLGVAGVSAWRLGLEDPAFWDLWKPRP